MRLVILTGASGSGKTAIAEAIEFERAALVDVLHFDSIGIPSSQAIVAEWGSGEAWQRAKTIEWMGRIAELRTRERALLFEGQTRLAFLREGLHAAGIGDAQIILVDCDDETRARRILAFRNQPELANAQMMNWAAFLRAEARDTGCEILDTSHIPFKASVAYVRSRLMDRAHIS